MIGLKLHLLGLMVLFALLSQTQQLHSSVDIGSISELRGNAQVLRDKPYGAELDFGILSYDKVETAMDRDWETQTVPLEPTDVILSQSLSDVDSWSILNVLDPPV